MAETIRDRADRLLRGALETHIDLLAVLLAETGLTYDTQIERLDRLIRTLQASRFEPTIFDDGRRIPAAIDFETVPPALVLNEELLARVSDDEILSALAKPISQILEVAPVSVAVALQIHDDRFIRSLTTKATRRTDQVTARANDIPAFVAYKMHVFERRLRTVASALGSAVDFDVATTEETLTALRGRASWPEWTDVLNLRLAERVVERLRYALRDTDWRDHADKLAELVWDSLALSGQTFLRHAGRALRGENVPHLSDVLRALLTATSEQERTLTSHLSSWTVYADVHHAWLQLDDAERQTFGVSTGTKDRTDVSVVDEAGLAFGIHEPASLPWDVPLVCWTVREQSALHDLFVGIAKTLPVTSSVQFLSLSELVRDAPRLGETEAGAWILQVANPRSEPSVVDANQIAQAYSSSLTTMMEQFRALPRSHQDEAIRRTRKAYDDYFPKRTEVWTRRFAGTKGSDFRELLTQIQQMVSSPVLFDPFLRPSSDELAPYPTLTTVVARPVNATTIPFWVPLSLLTSTRLGPPIRTRLVHVSEAGCAWDCDKTVSLPKLNTQPVDLVLTAVRGDSLQFVFSRE